MDLRRQPLLRLLAINLAIGVAVAVIMLAGLLALSPHRLRDLILADSSAVVAVGLLLFGLLITFGSAAMGTAVMMLGRDDRRDASGGRARGPLLMEVPAAAQLRADEVTE
jgi:hypothetical protein